jgi:hypothetical protein
MLSCSNVEGCCTDAHSLAVGPCHQGLSGFECCKIHGSNRYYPSSIGSQLQLGRYVTLYMNALNTV